MSVPFDIGVGVLFGLALAAGVLYTLWLARIHKRL